MNTHITSKVLKILILEDSRDDVNLVERELKKSGIAFTSLITTKRDEFEDALGAFDPDVILSDHSLPQFNSIEALVLYKQHEQQTQKKIPFILVTGAVSEEFAVQCIKAGADDYILKDRLKRLPSAILTNLERIKMEDEKRKFLSDVMENEALMKEAEHLAHFGSWQVDLRTGKHKWSQESYRIFGYEAGEIDPDNEKFLRHVHPDDKESLRIALDEAISHLHTRDFQYRILDKNQKVRYLHTKVMVQRNDEQKAMRLVGFTMDVTEQRWQTQTLEAQNTQLREIAWTQSHEVRAPLARMMGLIQLMLHHNDETMTIRETMSHILSSANELDGIIRRIVRRTEEIEIKQH